jgi:hypothetical protein
MEHLSVSHSSNGTTVTCGGCGVDWLIEPGAPMVARLDAFADLHLRCAVNRVVLPTASPAPASMATSHR